MTDDVTVERAIGMLMAQRGFNADQAGDMIAEIALRQGRSSIDVARAFLAYPRSSASAVRLSHAYQEIGEAINVLPKDLALRRVTEIAVERVGGAAWASLTLLHAGKLTTVAATHPSAFAADQIQYELSEGPCVAAVTGPGGANLADDLRSEDRWPNFSARAHEQLNVGALLGLRLGLDVDGLDDTVASLNIYATDPDPFSDEAIVVATLIAAHASAALIASRYQQRVEHLETALTTSREIGVAMGILMHQHKILREEAFGLLRVASQHTNRKLRDIAADVADTGTLALPGP